MANRFTGLTIDEEERSTNNLSRKLEKMRRMQERNPTAERECKIQELDSIVNPPKSTTQPKKKKKKNFTIFMTISLIISQMKISYIVFMINYHY